MDRGNVSRAYNPKGRLCCAESEMKDKGKCHTAQMRLRRMLVHSGLKHVSMAGRANPRQPNSSPNGPPINKTRTKFTGTINQRTPKGT